jgi:4-cresol dehydrogenase (hydroxylating) flavoprotein subunit
MNMQHDNMINAFIKAIGKENVILEADTIKNAEKTNYRTNQKILAIVRPANTEEVKRCIEIANEYKVPVYPVSRGKNWGYGSRVPVKTDSVVIELQRLNQILELNEKQGYVTIEPGVTFQQLFEYLRERKSELLISGTGGPIDSSLVGNALERGLGTGLYADRFASVCGMEIGLPDASVISSGFKRFGSTTVSNVYKYGMGPSIDGLFSQSNFGIVTKLTMWLMPCPEYLQLIFYKNNSQEKMQGLIDALHGLAMNGLVRPAITIYNDLRVFSAMMQYPWQSCTPGQNSSADVRAAIRTYPGINDMIGMWNGEVSIRSVSQEHGKMQYDLISERIKDHVDSLAFVEVSKAEIMKILDDHYRGNFAGHDADIIKSFLVRKYIGIPDNFPIRAAYWRKKTPIPEVMNPDTDNCGMIWMSPVVPFDGAELENAVNIISSVIEKHHFEPAITFQCITERAINIIISLSWDRDVDGEDKRAEDCYLDLNATLKESGYLSYRTTTLSMLHKNLVSGADDYDNFLNNIKKAIDPNNIMAPGRYNIG